MFYHYTRKARTATYFPTKILHHLLKMLKRSVASLASDLSHYIMVNAIYANANNAVKNPITTSIGLNINFTALQ